MIADAIFMLSIYLGLVNFLGIPIIQMFLWLFGSFILIYSGIENILGANKFSFDSSRIRDSLFRCFLKGFIMSITSPLSILFWLGIYGSVLAKTASSYGTGHLLLYSSMIFLGLAVWDIIVASMTTGLRRYLNYKSLIGISIFSGLSLIGFGLYFGFEGIRAVLESFQ